MVKQVARTYFQKLGAHVAGLRKSCGMTQEELARAMGVSQQRLHGYETGYGQMPVVVLMKLARVFGISIDDLVGLKHTTRRLRRRLSPKALRHAHRLEMLPKAQQRFVLRVLTELEDSNKGMRAAAAKASGRRVASRE